MKNTLGCPHCGSDNVRRRRTWHLLNNWRCKKCDRIFIKPKIQLRERRDK